MADIIAVFVQIGNHGSGWTCISLAVRVEHFAHGDE
jgi:hypothetical protein